MAKFEKPKGDPSAFLKPATTVLSPYLKVSELSNSFYHRFVCLLFVSLWYVVTSFPHFSFNFLINFSGSLGVSLPGTSINVFKIYIKMSKGIQHLQFPLLDRFIIVPIRHRNVMVSVFVVTKFVFLNSFYGESFSILQLLERLILTG